MDRQTAERRIQDTFSQPFDDAMFRVFTRDLLNDIDETKAFEYHGQYIPDSFKQHITQYKRVGKYVDPDGNSLDVLIVYLRKGSALERARTTQRNFVGWYLNGGRGAENLREGALVAFVAPEEEDWRFSFVRMEYKQEMTESGLVKVREELTPARRYSFLVGKNEPNHTAQQQIVPILQDDRHNPTISELEQAFSVEAVTKRFYTDYRDLFEKLTGELDRIVEQDARVREEFESKTIEAANFAKKLLGQIVFLYFLQKKGWLGVGKDGQGNLKPWGTGPKNFLQRLFKRELINYGNFFNDVLEPLFYHALATEHDYDYYPHLQCKIPFLNGGLFEAIHDYNWQEIHIPLPNNLFQQIFDTFDFYNFTVREDQPLEKEVAIDPEMLGKVFENLLPENLRKGKGTYYTPRPIVHYMCQESLINYLAGECEGIVAKEDIEELVRRGEFTVEHDAITVQKLSENRDYKGNYKTPKLPKSIISNAQLLDDKLAGIKVCDPAVGSGAFPVGMMHEIVKARNVLNNHLSKKSGRDAYTLKRHCIQESLYGVDIDPGAIDIAKLRLWLSLIVDEEDYERINPLPNLDYKIMQGNSLIEDFHGISLDLGKSDNGDLLGKDPELERLIKDLHEKQNAFFNATHPGEKRRLKDAVEEAVLAVFHYRLEQERKPYYESLKSIERTASTFREQLRDDYMQKETKRLKKHFDFDPEAVEDELREMTHGNKLRSFFPWRLYFADIFQKKGGFDLVMANPPYIQLQKDGGALANMYEKCGYATFERTGDIYALFYEQGTNILRHHGVLCFITSNKWMRAGYGKSLRTFFLKHNPRLLIDLGPGIFESATVDTNILIMQKAGTTPASLRVDAVTLTEEAKNGGIASYIKANRTRLTTLSENAWFIGSTAEQRLKEKIERVGKPLKDWDVNIHRGVLTGLNEAFIIDTPTKERLCAEDPKSAQILKPILRGRDIRRYSYDWKGLWVVATFPALHVDIHQYPAVKKHLLNFGRERLEQAGKTLANGTKSRKKTGNKWFETQDQIGYYPEFKKEKVVWKALSLEPAFSLVPSGFFNNDKANLLTSKKNDTKYLCALMNSKLFQFYFSSIGVSMGAGYEYKIQFVEKIPFPPIASANQLTASHIEELVDSILSAKKENLQADTQELEREIDQMVYQLYGLTEEEIRIVEEATE